MTTLTARTFSWAAPKRRRRRALGRVLRAAAPVLPRKPPPRDPIFILGAPRSGTTMLFEILNRSSDLASLERETGVIWDAFHRIEELDWVSHAVPPEAITARERRTLYWAIERLTLGKRYLDKLPRNTLRVPYLKTLFPDAWFVFLRRDGRAVVSSLMTGWREPGGRFGRGMEPPIPLQIEGYDGRIWKFLLPPGWEGLAQGHTLAEVCAFQWVAANESILASRELIASDHWAEISYEELVARPRDSASAVLRALHLPERSEVLSYAEELDRHVTKKAVTPPRAEKWRQENGVAVESVMPTISPMMRRLGYPLD